MNDAEEFLRNTLEHDVPATSLPATIERHLEAFATTLPQTCLDSPTARRLIASHLARNRVMVENILIQELVGALTRVEPLVAFFYQERREKYGQGMGFDNDLGILGDIRKALGRAKEVGY